MNIAKGMFVQKCRTGGKPSTWFPPGGLEAELVRKMRRIKRQATKATRASESESESESEGEDEGEGEGEGEG